MINLVLDRFATCEQGTFGRLSLAPTPGSLGTITPITPPIYTAERPWAGNQSHVSCIPAGEYSCAPRHYHRGGYPAWEVLDVPDRTDILWHRGNRSRDVKGCIVVGTLLGALEGEWAVLHSSTAWGRLWGVVGWGPGGAEGGVGAAFRLSIRWAIP